MSGNEKPGSVPDAMHWKFRGVRVVKGDKLDPNVPQTQGMSRAAAINFARVGAEKIPSCRTRR